MRRAGTLCGIVLPLLLLVAPLPVAFAGFRLVGALVVFAVIFWMSEALPNELTALMLLFLLAVLQVAPNRVVFSGFTSSAWWLVFSGLTLGAAVQKTGLGRRLALKLMQVAGTSYTRILFGLMLSSFLLALLIPSSSARTALMVPLAVGVAEAFDFARRTPAGAGLILGVTAACHFPSFGIMTANVPNLVLMGSAESLFNTTYYYGSWALLLFPTLGIAKFFLIFWVVLMLFGRRTGASSEGGSGKKSAGVLGGARQQAGPMSAEEKRLIVVLGLALVGWMTDSLHHINPSWIGLGAALIVFIPHLGMLERRDFRTRINYSALFFLAGILGLGSTLYHTGLGTLLGDFMFAHIPLAMMSDVVRTVVIAVFTALFGLVTTVPALPAVLTPILGSLAEQQHLDVAKLVFTQALGFSVGFFSYTMPPFVLAQGFGYFSSRQATRFLLLLSGLSFLLILPLTIGYWRLLGYLQ